MRKRGITVEAAQKVRKSQGLKETKLQRMRVKRGLTQGELAAASGVTQRAIQCYEQELRPIEGAKLETLCDLSIALGCKIEDIIDSKKLLGKYRKAK